MLRRHVEFETGSIAYCAAWQLQYVHVYFRNSVSFYSWYKLSVFTTSIYAQVAFLDIVTPCMRQMVYLFAKCCKRKHFNGHYWVKEWMNGFTWLVVRCHLSKDASLAFDILWLVICEAGPVCLPIYVSRKMPAFCWKTLIRTEFGMEYCIWLS